MAVNPINSLLFDVVGTKIADAITANTLLLQKSALRLSTGLRILNAGDDPSGTGILVNLKASITRNSAASTNIANTLSFVDTQTSFLTDIQNALNDMATVATNATNSAMTATDRSASQSEFAAKQAFISLTVGKTFNAISLFSSANLSVLIDTNGGTFSLQGLNAGAASTAGGLAAAFSGAISVGATTTGASAALTEVNTALANLSALKTRASASASVLGLYNQTLTDSSNGLQNMANRIELVDTTAESNKFSNLNVLVQGGTNVLATWNTLRLNLLTLLK